MTRGSTSDIYSILSTISISTGLSEEQLKSFTDYFVKLQEEAELNGRLDELIWSTGVEYKYDRDRDIVQKRIEQLQRAVKDYKGAWKKPDGGF